MRWVGIVALVLALGSPQAVWSSTEPVYKNPFDLAVSPDGDTLLVACSGSNSVVVIDAMEGTMRTTMRGNR